MAGSARARGGALVVALCLPVALGLSIGAPATGAAPPAPPGHSQPEHVGHSDLTGAEHAAEDLAGTPISQIERETGTVKQRLRRETGTDPGAARSAPSATGEATYAAGAVSADPGVSGTWSPVIDTPVVPVYDALLPNGKVLIWDSVGENATETYPSHTFTRAMVWNPATDTYKRVDVQGYNLFCAGFAHLSNGNVFVAGGTKDATLAGIVQTHVFNWQTETWTRGPDMAAGRWYPSVAAMANGEATVVGGGASPAEVYQTNNTIRPLPGFTAYPERVYPFMVSRPDAQLGLLGPDSTIYTLNTSGKGAVTGTTQRDDKNRSYGSFATYDIGRSLVVGGGTLTENGIPDVPTTTAVIVNTNAGLVPSVSATGSLSVGRRQFTTTVLADGSVLATGGLTDASTSTLVDLDHAITAAERWDPATGSWTVLSSAARIRQYHSTALLLPDGRVLTGGGGICDRCTQVGYLERNVEYFTPPYLYRQDGSGQLAPRPVISTAPTSVAVNTGFTVTSSQASTVRKVALVGLSDVTHGVDQGQRYVPLAFTASGSTLTVTGPPNSGVAPPGYYLLLLTDAAGVPSQARVVQVAKGPKPVMSTLKSTGAGLCLEVPGGALAPKTYLATRSCSSTIGQAVTRLPNDKTLRVVGNCVEVPSTRYAVGQKVWTNRCSGVGAQTWDFPSDSSIRPAARWSLCLAPVSTGSGAALALATCNGSALQKWTR